MNKAVIKTAPVGSVQVFSSTATGTSSFITVQSTSESGASTALSHSARDAQSAVYAYLQAMRALGRTTINTNEVAKALGINRARVLETLDALKKKGVKVG